MSRKDRRRSMPVRVPEALRRRLVAGPGRHPLPALLRAAVLRGLREGRALQRRAPGAARPVPLQLSAAERAAVGALAQQKGWSEEDVVIALAEAGCPGAGAGGDSPAP